MSRKITLKLFAAALALSPISLVSTTLPASAQGNFRVSFGYFYDTLAPYGVVSPSEVGGCVAAKKGRARLPPL